MLYISGIYALNLTCELNTPGDWHRSALDWNKFTLKDSSKSIFKDYGIEKNKKIPEHEELYNVANHIRALLDLLVEGKFLVAQGMKNDFIVVDEYNAEIFEKVMVLRKEPNWEKIDEFMNKEYRMLWINFKKSEGLNNGE